MGMYQSMWASQVAGLVILICTLLLHLQRYTVSVASQGSISTRKMSEQWIDIYFMFIELLYKSNIVPTIMWLYWICVLLWLPTAGVSSLICKRLVWMQVFIQNRAEALPESTESHTSPFADKTGHHCTYPVDSYLQPNNRHATLLLVWYCFIVSQPQSEESVKKLVRNAPDKLNTFHLSLGKHHEFFTSKNSQKCNDTASCGC